jgi:hypothetical protein
MVDVEVGLFVGVNVCVAVAVGLGRAATLNRNANSNNRKTAASKIAVGSRGLRSVNLSNIILTHGVDSACCTSGGQVYHPWTSLQL